MSHYFIWLIANQAWKAFWANAWPRGGNTTHPFTEIDWGSRSTLYVIDAETRTRRRIGPKT